MTSSNKSMQKLGSLLVVLLLLCFQLATSSTIDQCESNNQNPTCTRKATTIPTASSEKDYNTFNIECSCQPHSIREEDGGARIAYLITLHNQRTLDESVALLKRIVAPGFIVLIHVDTKFPKEKWSQDSELMKYIQDENCGCCGATVLIKSYFACQWGTFSMLDPTLWAMEQLTFNERFKNKWDVFMNLSADNLPVYTPKVLSNYFSNELEGINFVTSSSCFTGLLPTGIDQFPRHWSKRLHYSVGGKWKISFKQYNGSDDDKNQVSNTIELKIYFGSQWVTLTPPVVAFIAKSMNQTESLPMKFKDELIRRKRIMADETFIPTLIAHHSDFRATFPKLAENGSLLAKSDMFAVRYERMDEHMPSASLEVVEQQRYEVPKSLKDHIDRPHVWGPYYLGVYDLANIIDSGALFIRKVCREIDPNLFNLLPVNHKDDIPRIQWPQELNITEKPDWDKWFTSSEREKN